MSRRLIVLLAVIVGLFVLAPVVGASEHNDTFTANLKARNETADVDSNATGQAIVKLRNGELSYKLIVANIDNAFVAHIHCGAKGQDGPPGVTLFGPAAPISNNGILAQGDITAPDAGNGCEWTTFAEVIAALKSGDTYVNVHTTDGIEDPAGPAGDYPNGEIRGQLS